MRPRFLMRLPLLSYSGFASHHAPSLLIAGVMISACTAAPPEPAPCEPLATPEESLAPAAWVLPPSRALLGPHQPVVVRFSEYMHPDSLQISGDLEPSTTWWEPPYEVLLLEPPEGGWPTAGSLQIQAADPYCNELPALEVVYEGMGEPRPLLSAELRYFLTADDDGDREVPLTPEVADLWLEATNLVYEDARMAFSLAQDDDAWVVVRDTALNELWVGSDPEVLASAEALVAPYPETLNVIYSWGPLPDPAFGGFASPHLPYISVTSYAETLVCGALSSHVLPHEMGHHFGLPHTHQAEFHSVDQAQAAFNGAFLPWDDGFPGTPALPHIRSSLCDPPAQLELGDILRTTRPDNLMNYDWTPTSHLTWAQADVARQTLALRYGHDLRDLVSPPADLLLEAEALTPQSGTWGVQGDMASFFGAWSEDAQHLWVPEGNETGSLRVPLPSAGTYRVFASFTLGPDFGVHEVGFEGQPRTRISLYSPMVRAGQLVDLGTHVLEEGTNLLGVTSLGAEPASDGALFGLDYLLLREEAERPL